ncbi:MAG TPA: hypothetical protein P5049_01730 [Methanothrix sp.]|nr:hypothetical protein [Methanothrix sp.]
MKLKAILCVLALVALAMQASIAEEYSDDYKAGYADGMNTAWFPVFANGLLSGAVITMDVLSDTASEYYGTSIGSFCNSFVRTASESHNELVTTYNIIVTVTNNKTVTILGEDYPGIDNITLTEMPYYR